MSKAKKEYLRDSYIKKLKEGKEAYDSRRDYYKNMSLRNKKNNGSGESSDSSSVGVVKPVVTSGDWVTEYKRFLSEDEALQNAQKVAYHFYGTDWTPEAISALCGNMRKESTLNPDMYEHGYDWSADRGYGLVQWTPRSKYWNWAEQNGLDPRSGDSQLARIDWEVDNQTQWIPISRYNKMSFADFRQNSGNWDVEYLTEAFTWSYERPAESAGNDSMPGRKAFAKTCLVSLDFSSGGSKEDLAIRAKSKNHTELATDKNILTAEDLKVEPLSFPSVPVGKIHGSKFSAPNHIRSVYVYERKLSEGFRKKEGYMPLPSHEFIHMAGPQENFYAPEAFQLFRLLKDRLNYKQMVITRGYEPDGNNTSSHSIGIAMDIYAPTAIEAIRIADAAFSIGIRSIAIGPKFVHVDAGPEATWGYNNLGVYRGPGTLKVGAIEHGFR